MSQSTLDRMNEEYKKRKEKFEKQIDLNKAPAVLLARVGEAIEGTEKNRKTGADEPIINVELVTNDGAIAKQKYSLVHAQRLGEVLKKLGYTNLNDIKNPIQWKRETFSIGYPRYIPVITDEQRT